MGRRHDHYSCGDVGVLRISLVFAPIASLSIVAYLVQGCVPRSASLLFTGFRMKFLLLFSNKMFLKYGYSCAATALLTG